VLCAATGASQREAMAAAAAIKKRERPVSMVICVVATYGVNRLPRGSFPL